MAYSSKLALFQPPPVETGILGEQFIEFRPTTTLSDGAAIEFSILGTSAYYIDLKKSRLAVKIKVTKADGSPLDDPPEEPAASAAQNVKDKYVQDMTNYKKNTVAVSNMILHSLFRQVDVSLQQKVISPEIGVNYPYKAILDVLLNYGHEVQGSQLQAEGFYKDNGLVTTERGEDGELDEKHIPAPKEPTNFNFGEVLRWGLTDNNETLTLEGPLHVDICQMDRLVMNGVQIVVKLFPSLNGFCLRTGGGCAEKYKVKILDAVLKVCHAKVNPKIMVAHNEVLTENVALYPFWKSEIKTFSIPQGSSTQTMNDLFHSKCPQRLVVGFVNSKAYVGNYHFNPFNFQHFNLSYLEFSLDGRSVPGEAIKANFEEKDFVDAYTTLFNSRYPACGSADFIEKKDYPQGYALYVFNLESYVQGAMMSNTIEGHTRLTVRFDKPIPEGGATMIVYGQFPSVMKIDKSRNVILS